MLDPSRMDDVLRRGDPEVASGVSAWKGLDEKRRRLQGELDGLRQQRNAANEKMGKLDKKGPDFAAARDELKNLSGRIKTGETELQQIEADWEDHLFRLPNAPHASTPTGAGDADNPVLHTWGDRKSVV